jgi:hypothetical protein
MLHSRVLECLQPDGGGARYLFRRVGYMTLAIRSRAGCAMDRSEQFWDFAEECDRLAQEAETEQQRSALRKMAGAWRRVAEEYDREVLNSH